MPLDQNDLNAIQSMISAAAAGRGGGISNREIKRLRRELLRKIQSSECCPPVPLITQDFTPSIGGGFPINLQVIVSTADVDQPLSAEAIPVIGASVDLAFTDPVVSIIAEADGFLTDVSVAMSVTNGQDGDDFLVLLRNNCGCATKFFRVTLQA